MAGTRMAMALLLAFWVWLEPSEPARQVSATLPLFAAYLTFAIGMLAIAYRSWWFEFRLAWPGFVIDAATFVTGLAITEAVTLSYFSAFMAFFVYLLLSSAMRWGRGQTLAIAGLLALGFLLAGLLVDWRGLDIDLPKFARHFGYLVIVSLMLIWFADTRTRAQAPRFVRASLTDRDDPLVEGLDYAMQVYGARGGVVAWLGEGETRPRVKSAGTVAAPAEGAPLMRIDLDDAPDPMLFDTRHRRRLRLDGEERLLSDQGTPTDAVAAAFALNDGISIPIASQTGRGRLVLTGIAGLCFDDLFPARSVAREIAAAVDGEETEALAREVAMSRLRSQIATDLHDSVVQTLAGASFRLEALGQAAAAGPLTPEIKAINTAIVDEQARVRTMIDSLRRGTVSPGERDLRQEVAALVGPLGEQWRIAIDVAVTPNAPLILNTSITFEIQQIMREAVANAARHGQAETVRFEFEVPTPDRLVLTAIDDGKGFAVDAATLPRSLSERLARLNGTMQLTSSTSGTRITMTIPIARTA